MYFFSYFYDRHGSRPRPPRNFLNRHPRNSTESSPNATRIGNGTHRSRFFESSILGSRFPFFLFPLFLSLFANSIPFIRPPTLAPIFLSKTLFAALKHLPSCLASFITLLRFPSPLLRDWWGSICTLILRERPMVFYLREIKPPRRHEVLFRVFLFSPRLSRGFHLPCLR